MNSTSLLFAALAAAFLTAGSVSAEDIRYWGRVPGSPSRGVIEMRGQQYTVSEGDQIPGAGTIVHVADDVLVIQHRLTDAEKDQLEAQGAIAPDIKEQRLPNLSREILPR